MKFYAHKTVLTQNSAYFERALNGAFLESNTQSIDFDDIDAEDFGRYVNVVYQTVLTQNVTLIDVNDPLRPCSGVLPRFLRLWQLADRFLDSKTKAVAETSIDSTFALLTVRAWENIEEPYLPAGMSNRFKRLQLAFDLCKQEHIPYHDHLVTGLANCPPQIFTEHVDDLSGDCKRAVIKAFALRFVDCQAKKQFVIKQMTKRKRSRYIEDEMI